MDGETAPPSDGLRPWGLLASARRVGGYAWTERRLFEVVGAWASDASDPGVVVLFDSQARHHAGHARTFVERLPELRELPRDEAVAAPAGGWEAFVDALGDLDAVDADRLAVLAQVVTPHLVETYRAHAGRVTTVGDAPLLRSLAAVVADLEADRAAATRLLGDLGADGGNSTDTAVDRCRAALAATAGLAGPTLDVDVLA